MRVSVTRDRERDRGTLSAGYLRVPGFPEELRDNKIPRADGQPGERDQTYYGREWVQAERVRQLKLMHDLVYQFVVLVAQKTGAEASRYWRGDADNHSMFDWLVAGVVSRSAMRPGTTLPESTIEKHRKDIMMAFSKIDDLATKERVDRMLSGEAGDRAREALLQRPEQQQAWERVLREHRGDSGSSRSAPASRPPSTYEQAVSRASTSAPHFGVPPPPPQSSAVDPQSSTVPPQQPRPAVRFVTEDPGLTSGGLAAAEQTGKSLAALDPKTGQLVYGIDDQWIMLLRLLLRGATESDLKAWRILYGVDSPSGLDDPAAREKYLRDLSKMQQLINEGEGPLEWVTAPQHTGYIFFTDAFSGATVAALTDVHTLCGKAWATELALMTHPKVRDRYAELVAVHIRRPKMTVVSRWGGSQAAADAETRQHGKLLQFFRRLVRQSDGQYVCDGQSDPAGDAQRRVQERDDWRRVRQTGEYPAADYY